MERNEDILQKIQDVILETADPLKIILFGSAARGEMDENSDYDLFVVVPEGTHRRQTAQEIHQNLIGIKYGADIVVVTEKDLEEYKNENGLIFKTILEEGEELYAA